MTWNNTSPAISNSIAADVADILENFQHSHDTSGNVDTVNMGGNLITLDADGDSKIGCDTDDVLTVDLNSTEVVNVGTTGVVTLAQNSAARAYRSGNQSVDSASETVVAFNAETYDIRSEFDSAVNYEFVAGVAGKYLINTQVVLESVNSGVVAIVNVRKAEATIATNRQKAHVNGQTLYVQCTTIASLAATNDIDVTITHDHGSARNVSGGASGTYIEVIKLA